MCRRAILLAVLLMVGSCSPGARPIPSQFDPTVNSNLQPAQPTVPDAQGNSQSVAASRDEQGVQTDFVEGVVLVRPKSVAELQDFLDRYGGTIVSDDTVPDPPASLGMTLTADQRKPTEYVVHIDLSTADVSNFVTNATEAGLTGVMEFSSQAGLQTLAAVADAVVMGFDASPDFVSTSTQAFPVTLFSTQERSDGKGGFNDAFATTRFQTTGSQSNVTLAWQFLGAHGVQRRAQVAIIDGGFWLNTNGTPRGTDSDFPANPIQYDFIGNDYLADGPNANQCGGGPCFWHGTGSAGVAAGVINNTAGAAGTGGLAADPFLFKVNGRRSQSNWAIRTAVAWGADVVSMSWGGDCNQSCRAYDREHTPFDDAINAGSKTVFVAAAGNGDSAGNGYDVGDPHFVHPCIEDHVICVGALNDDATTRIGYSNFGGAVDIFAPTNIPVMAQPAGNDNNPAGPASPRSFGGTSAATPFVAGVVAMMKAINPDLDNDQVAEILTQTAHPGAGQVGRYIDAYAAVRRAADGIPEVSDRFETNDITPTDLGAGNSYNQTNLNLDARDRDYFNFGAPAASTMTVDLRYPEALGNISLLSLDSLGECGSPSFISDSDLGGNGHRLTFQVPGGSLQLALRADDVNAYDLGISFATATFSPDSYESNDQPSTARWIYSFKTVGVGLLSYLGIEPRVTIDANIHNATDVDYYIVRGATLTVADRVLLAGYPAVKVYGNESPITLEVYQLNPDNTPGPLVQSASGGSCAGQPATVRLDENVAYLVRVAGTPGRYVLRNGVDGSRIHLPDLARDKVYTLLHPGEPVEHKIRFPEIYVFAADAAFRQVRVAGPGLHVQLFDSNSNLMAEGQQDDQGELLTLASTMKGQIYALLITPQLADGDEQTLNITWEFTQASQVSGNLIVNGGAEDGPANETNGLVDDIPGWYMPDVGDLFLPTVIYYGGPDGVPTADSPGPSDRGSKLFAGGTENIRSGIEQSVSIDPSWQGAISQGFVRFTFSAFLGGYLEQDDYAVATLTFTDANYQPLGVVNLPTVKSRERENQTGLWPVQADDYVPAGTVFVFVDLNFYLEAGDYNDAYADNIELTLSDYTP